MDVDLQQLRALSAAVEEGTLDAAARRLHVTPSAVSQRLRALETAAGRVLLVRSRPVRPTASGEAVLRLARQVELLAADAVAELGEPDDPDAPVALAVAVNADSLATWVLPALAPLADRVALQLLREDEGRTSALLRDGTAVGAITTDAVAVPGCTVTALGAMRYRVKASPSVAARWFPDGPTPDALARAPVVVFDRDDPLQHGYLAAHAPDARPPMHLVPSSTDYAEAVRLGFGWGMLPDLQAPAGDPGLVDLDPGAAVDVPLHWQQWRLRSPSLDRVSAALVGAARAALVPPGRA